MSDNLSSPEVKKKINYQICCLYQKGSRSDKQIRKPYTRTQNHGSYTAIEKEIHASINDGYILPFELSATTLDNRNGITNTLLSKKLFIITLAKNSLEAEQRKENGMMKITVIVLIMRIQSIISAQRKLERTLMLALVGKFRHAVCVPNKKVQ